MWEFHLLIATALAGVASCAGANLTPPKPPSWLGEHTRSATSPLLLGQSVTIEKDHLRVCRTLTNRAQKGVLIATVRPEGSSANQFSTFFFDESGNLVPPRGGTSHGSFVPPVLTHEGKAETTILKPESSAENCQALPIPHDMGVVQLVSLYSPILDVPPAEQKDDLLVAARGMEILSNTCVVHVHQRRVRCSA